MTARVPGIERDAVAHARRVWVEQRLFEVLGGWVATTEEPEARMALATSCRRHEWHARLWHDLVPAIGTPPVEVRITCPGPGWEAVLDAVAGATSTVERLSGAWRAVLAHLIATDDARLAVTTPVADAPLRRVLGLVLADDVEEWRAAEVLIRGLAGDEAPLYAALEHQAQVEHLLLATRTR